MFINVYYIYGGTWVGRVMTGRPYPGTVSVRECVGLFYVFFQISNTWLFTFFLKWRIKKS